MMIIILVASSIGGFVNGLVRIVVFAISDKLVRLLVILDVGVE